MTPLRRMALALVPLLVCGLSVASSPAQASLATQPVAEDAADFGKALGEQVDAGRRIALEDPLRAPSSFGGADEEAQSRTAVAVFGEADLRNHPPLPTERRPASRFSHPSERSYDAQAPPRG